jgi:hypothetical protein
VALQPTMPKVKMTENIMLITEVPL